MSIVYHMCRRCGICRLMYVVLFENYSSLQTQFFSDTQMHVFSCGKYKLHWLQYCYMLSKEGVQCHTSPESGVMSDKHSCSLLVVFMFHDYTNVMML